MSTTLEDIGMQDIKIKRWLMANLVFIVTSVFVGGAWVRGIEKEIQYLSEQMEVRTSDRFYRQDGLVLEQRIVSLENNYARIEDALVRLDNKLDSKL